MPALAVDIVRFVDEHQPGFVECRLLDAQGHTHCFIEKVPVVSTENLSSSSTYPRPGTIACQIVQRSMDGSRQLLKVNTELPWHVESTTGATEFVVALAQVEQNRER